MSAPAVDPDAEEDALILVCQEYSAREMSTRALIYVVCVTQEAERIAMDMRARCEVCAGGPIDREMMDHFRLAVCWPCKRADVTDNYKLITKTTARTDFFLTDKELEGA